MTENTENLNDLSANMEPKAIRIFNGRIHVTASFLCRRFSIRPELFKQTIDTVIDDDGSIPLERDGEKWIDDALFYDLANTPELSPYFPEERQQAVLHLLGHFEPRPAGAAVTRGHSCA